jgi:hypothetical protein
MHGVVPSNSDFGERPACPSVTSSFLPESDQLEKRKLFCNQGISAGRYC